jgi:siroheme synthase (precorrin-2 oxidase/ferrochelatase)
LRLILEDFFPERWKRIAALAAAFRVRVGNRWPDDRRRRVECYERFVGADWTALLKQGEDAVERELEALLEGEAGPT